MSRLTQALSATYLANPLIEVRSIPQRRVQVILSYELGHVSELIAQQVLIIKKKWSQTSVGVIFFLTRGHSLQR